MQLTVENMSCNDCVLAVTRAVQTLDPKAKVIVNLPRKQVHANGALTAPATVEALAAAGFAAALTTTGALPAPRATRHCGCGCKPH
jgi:copper chaperone